jgi:glycosyltransferase involved in cell wall biosynthesis
MIQKLYNKALALLMPGIEDFGITALEASAEGVPAILNMNSGAAEIIKHQKHGIHIKIETVRSLIKAIALREKTNFDSKLLKKNLTKYDTNSFAANFQQQVNNIIKERQNAI